MEEKKRCCFAGHSKIYQSNIAELVCAQVEFLIREKNVTEFWVGNYGEFDRICTGVVLHLKKHYDVNLFLIVPYLTKSLNDNRNMHYKKYDGIYIADMPINTPPHLKILKSNQYMVDNSDYLLCFVNTSWGGAAKTLEYARKRNIEIISLI